MGGVEFWHGVAGSMGWVFGWMGCGSIDCSSAQGSSGSEAWSWDSLREGRGTDLEGLELLVLEILLGRPG